MNFQYIPPLENSTDLLDLAFRKARRKGQGKKLVGNWLQIIRKKEGMKLDIVKDSLVPKLDKVLDNFPGLADLPTFYIELMKLTLDYPMFKKSLGSIDWASKRIRILHKSYVSMIMKEKDRAKINNLVKQFYGRVSSVIKQMDKFFKYLEKARRIMRTYPDVKDMYTVCIYGFPNVGKTTLLNSLTKTTAQVAPYAFTTTTINAGYFNVGKKKIQVFDVPGTLARKDKMNTVEQQADLVLKVLADVIIYVFDLSEYCGFSIQDQVKLYKKLNGKVLIYLSKTDILDPAGFTEPYFTKAELKKELGKLWEDKTLEE